MGQFAKFTSNKRAVGPGRLVQLAEKIRRPGIHGHVSENFLREFDTLAQGKTFGIRQYNGEAKSLITAQGAQYNATYSVLSAICDTIVHENIKVAA